MWAQRGVLFSVFALVLAGAALVAAWDAPEGGFTPATMRRIETSRRQGEQYAKYWVYFTDKHHQGSSQEELLISERRALLSELHPKAVTRRKLARGLSETAEDHLVLSIRDISVNREYVNGVLSLSEGIALAKSSKWRNAVSVSVRVKGQENVLKEVQELSFVKKVEPVMRGKCESEDFSGEEREESARPPRKDSRAASVGNYDYGGSEAQLAQIHVPELHDFGLDGTGVTVLICDSGFDLKHRCFASMDIADQHDFVNDDDDVENTNRESGYTRDPEEHGTATLSTVGGMDEGFLYGPAFRSTYLIAKTEDIVGECSIEEDNLAAALEWGEGLGAEIVTTSLGYQDWHTFADKDGSSELDQTIDMMAADYGVLVVAAAGNEHKENAGVAVPGDAKTALTVGAVTDKGVVTEFSCRGPTVDGRVKPEVCALGWHDYVASVDHIDPPYESMSGTSFATPLVAGVAALLKQQHPSWTPMDLREALITTASGADEVQMDAGWGVVNALAALDYQRPDPPPTDHGVCNEFSDCECDSGWYGAYCHYEKVPCSEACLGGYCDDDDHCSCSTRWLGKTCLGPCEAVEDGCASCLRVDQAECGWCIGSQQCMLLSEGACSTALTTTHCDTVIVVNDENTGDDSVMAVIILCFSVLLIAFVTLYFFCIIRPSSDDSK